MYPLHSSSYHVLLPLLVVAAFQLRAAAQTHADQVETLLSQYHEQGLFNGAAMVAENGEVIFKGGFSWFVGDVPIAGDTIRVIEHGGNIFGFTAGFWRMPEERNTVILLDNTFNSRIREVGRAVRSILYGGDPEVPGGEG